MSGFGSRQHFVAALKCAIPLLELHGHVDRMCRFGAEQKPVTAPAVEAPKEQMAAKPEAPAITPPPVVLAPSGAPTPEATASNAMPLAATAPTPKIVSFAPAAPVPPAENEQVKQLNAELERARQQIQPTFPFLG